MDLNNLDYKDKPLIKKSLILKNIEDINIYEAYLQCKVDVTKPMLSPFRNEKNPSFSFFVGDNDEILFQDFTLKLKGDCIKFVQVLFNLDYFEAMSKIAIDFQLNGKYQCKSINTNKKFTVSSINKTKLLQNINRLQKIGIKKRSWKTYDLIYWNRFGISKETLEKYNVYPVEYIFLYYNNEENPKPVKTDKYAYTFLEKKDNKKSYKIYQPFSRQFKWLNNHNSSVWQGWNNLPEKGEVLIITKSLKDVMSINDVLDIPAVSLQAESIDPKFSVINELKDRFKIIYIFYDNDFENEVNWGQKFAIELQNKFQLSNIYIPISFTSKDFSDLVSLYGSKQAKKIYYEEIIYNILPF